MLRENLLKRLLKYQEENKKLSVKWDAGGDQTIINFFLDGKDLRYHLSDDLLKNFARYLVEEFELPNVGEYYNQGGGMISIENGTKILFEYEEFAYGEIYDDNIESEIKLEGFSIDSNMESKKLLEELNQLELNFYGTTSFLLKEIDDFELSTPSYDYRVRKSKFAEIQNYIKKHALEKFSPPLEGSEILYVGKIKEDKIIFEEISQLKFYIDKNKQNESRYILEGTG